MKYCHKCGVTEGDSTALTIKQKINAVLDRYTRAPNRRTMIDELEAVVIEQVKIAHLYHAPQPPVAIEHDSPVGEKLYKLLSAPWPDDNDLPALLWRWAACFGPCTSYRKDRLVRALITAAARIEELEAKLLRAAAEVTALKR